MSNIVSYNESSIFKQAIFYRELGALLVNPSTTMEGLTNFGIKHGISFDIVFKPIQEIV